MVNAEAEVFQEERNFQSTHLQDQDDLHGLPARLYLGGVSPDPLPVQQQASFYLTSICSLHLRAVEQVGVVGWDGGVFGSMVSGV